MWGRPSKIVELPVKPAEARFHIYHARVKLNNMRFKLSKAGFKISERRAQAGGAYLGNAERVVKSAEQDAELTFQRAATDDGRADLRSRPVQCVAAESKRVSTRGNAAETGGQTGKRVVQRVAEGCDSAKQGEKVAGLPAGRVNTSSNAAGAADPDWGTPSKLLEERVQLLEEHVQLSEGDVQFPHQPVQLFEADVQLPDRGVGMPDGLPKPAEEGAGLVYACGNMSHAGVRRGFTARRSLRKGDRS